MELDRVPLWRGNHVQVKQLVEDFARYLYLPRLKNSNVLLNAISEGLNLLTWTQDSFAFADSFDEVAGRYQGLRGGTMVSVADAHASELLVKPDVAAAQLDAERAAVVPGGQSGTGTDTGNGSTTSSGGQSKSGDPKPTASQPTRFHGTAILDTTRVGRDASRIAEEVIAHLAGLVGASVTVTIEVEANIPDGAPDHVVRTVTENSQTLKFTSHGFETE